MSHDKLVGQLEEGVDVPFEQISRDALRSMIQEFVTRDGADCADVGCTLEDKIEQILQQLRDKKVKVVFDLTAQTANIIVC